jgi:alpha-tubulin suppressor-like RCC1 family protein
MNAGKALWIAARACALAFALCPNLRAGGIAMQVGAGAGHSCALTTAREVLCWGENSGGELGNPNGGRIATRVSGLDDAQAIAVGFRHSCALRYDGSVRCWGFNNYGQLGDGSTENRGTPVAVVLSTEAKAISAGGFHTCAELIDGTLRCWGANYSGQLGDNTTVNKTTPAIVALPGTALPVAATSAGLEHTCVVDKNFAAWCWGANGIGQLGDGSHVSSAVPVLLPQLSEGVKGISAGYSFSCGIHFGGSCWGLNASGNLGYGGTANQDLPIGVSGIGDILRIVAGGNHACAQDFDGVIYCWGSNNYGQIGDGTRTTRYTAVMAPQLSGNGTPLPATSLATGRDHTCIVVNGGAVRCWGFNFNGQLGDGSTVDSATPVNAIGFGDALFRDGFD